MSSFHDNHGIVPPRSQATCIFIGYQQEYDTLYPKVSFRDSIGEWWQRDGPDPVYKLTNPDRTGFLRRFGLWVRPTRNQSPKVQAGE